MNVINVIQPYRHLDMWVFDDPRVGLSAEPFVGGADSMIDRVTSHIPDAKHGFIMVFSGTPFPGAPIPVGVAAIGRHRQRLLLERP